jgi:hypothetical protein
LLGRREGRRVSRDGRRGGGRLDFLRRRALEPADARRGETHADTDQGVRTSAATRTPAKVRARTPSDIADLLIEISVQPE